MKSGRVRTFRSRNRRQTPGRPGQPRSEQRGEAKQPGLRRKTILVVEDNATFGGLLVALLRQEGYQAMRAWNAREGAKMARDRRPDLIILELSLPYSEQVDLLSELAAAEEIAGKPIVVVTSHPLPFLEEGENVAAIVAKPFDVDRMLNVMRKALGEPEKEIAEKDYGQDTHLHGW